MPDQPLDLGAVQMAHDADAYEVENGVQLVDWRKLWRETHDRETAFLSVLTATRRALEDVLGYAQSAGAVLVSSAAIARHTRAVNAGHAALALATDAP